MSQSKQIITQISLTALFAVIVGLFVLAQPGTPDGTLAGFNQDFGNCTVSESKVSIGHQASTTILTKDRTRQWVIVQQPINATNTVALSFGGVAVVGSGYELGTTTSPLPYEITFGPQAGVNTQDAVTAITSTGSTTVKVVQCAGNSYSIN